MSWTRRAFAWSALVGLAAGGFACATSAQAAEVGSSLVADAGCSTTTLALGTTVSASSPASRFYLTGDVTNLTAGETYTFVWGGSTVRGSVPLGRANSHGVIHAGELEVDVDHAVTDSSPEPFSIVDDSTHEGVGSGHIGVVARSATLCRVLHVLTNGRVDPSGAHVFHLTQQTDGNVVERDGRGAVRWAVGTAGHPGAATTMQSDGNLVVRDASGHVLWATNTAGHSNATLTLQTDDNIVLRDASGRALWSSGIH